MLPFSQKNKNLSLSKQKKSANARGQVLAEKVASLGFIKSIMIKRKKKLIIHSDSFLTKKKGQNNGQ